MRISPYSSLFSKTLTFIYRPRSIDALLSPYSSSAAAAAALQPHCMAEYLVTSCGFSREKATEASKLLGGIASRWQLDSVLGFFKSYGFDDAQVKKLLSWNPRWLLLDAEKTLAPKFRAFQDLGFSQSDIAHLVLSHPLVINHTLHTVVPKIQFWKGVLGSNDILVKFCRHRQWFLGYSIEKRIQPNIEILRDCGVTDKKLTMILKYHPKFIIQKSEALKALISRVEGLGVARSSGMFHWTLWVLYIVSPEKFNAHMKLFRGFGWLEADFLAAFRKAPVFLTSSLSSLHRKMEVLVNEFGCDPSYIALHPVILTLSLEKRLIPRHLFLTALKSRGLCIGDCKLTTYMIYSDKKFLERYVIRYKEEYPELIGLYNASLCNTSAL